MSTNIDEYIDGNRLTTNHIRQPGNPDAEIIGASELTTIQVAGKPQERPTLLIKYKGKELLWILNRTVAGKLRAAFGTGDSALWGGGIVEPVISRALGNEYIDCVNIRPYGRKRDGQ